mgnify:CR=1 FL=1
MHDLPLVGLRVLVMEDEFLIAMDVEQLCRDHGAAEVVLVRTLDGLRSGPAAEAAFHAAILDVTLAGCSTLAFAAGLAERGVPFIFATGYAETEGLFDAFPGVPVVGKPYAGGALIEALAGAIARARAS